MHKIRTHGYFYPATRTSHGKRIVSKNEHVIDSPTSLPSLRDQSGSITADSGRSYDRDYIGVSNSPSVPSHMNVSKATCTTTPPTIQKTKREKTDGAFPTKDDPQIAGQYPVKSESSPYLSARTLDSARSATPKPPLFASLRSLVTDSRATSTLLLDLEQNLDSF